MKRCFKCGEEKPVGQFYRHPRMADGHLNKCKRCTKRDVTRNRLAKIDHYIAYDRERSALPERAEGVARSQRKYPHKLQARRLVHRAIDRGELVRPDTCARCGAQGRIEASHDDYSQPLAVEWLCRACHVKKDRPRDYDV